MYCNRKRSSVVEESIYRTRWIQWR